MTDKLRDKLIGAWKLVSFVEKPLNGSPELPHGRKAHRHHHVHA